MRLIDADALIEDIKSFWDWDSIDGITATTVLKQTMTDISHTPTIDAVPVVRCGECKYLMVSGICNIFADGNIKPSASDFCSYGERKDNE